MHIGLLAGMGGGILLGCKAQLKIVHHAQDRLVAQEPQPKQEAPVPVVPLYKAEAPAATLSQPQLLPQSRAPTEMAALLPLSLPASAAGKQPASGLPVTFQAARLQSVACSIQRPSPPPTPARQPVAKVEAGQPATCKLQPGRSAAKRDAAVMQPRIDDAALEWQASSLAALSGQASQRKRQRARSPATASRPGTQANGAAGVPTVVPSSTRRMLPGCQRLMEGAPAAGPDAAARVVAHCIDAPADSVPPTRCRCSWGSCASMTCGALACHPHDWFCLEICVCCAVACDGCCWIQIFVLMLLCVDVWVQAPRPGTPDSSTATLAQRQRSDEAAADSAQAAPPHGQHVAAEARRSRVPAAGCLHPRAAFCSAAEASGRPSLGGL